MHSPSPPTLCPLHAHSPQDLIPYCPSLPRPAYPSLGPHLHVDKGPQVSPGQLQQQLNQGRVGSLHGQVQNCLVTLDLLREGERQRSRPDLLPWNSEFYGLPCRPHPGVPYVAVRVVYCIRVQPPGGRWQFTPYAALNCTFL